jgi:DNA-binding NtrC family response regulator
VIILPREILRHFEKIPSCVLDRVSFGGFLTKPRIAILDEDQETRECLLLMLQQSAEVSTFSAEDAFLRSGGLKECDCILVESSVARHLHLRFIEAGIRTPFIYLAAQPSIKDAIAAIKLGAVDYLGKPVVPQELSSALEAAQRQAHSGVPDRFFSATVALDPMLDVMERELICTALLRSRGVVGGRKGAAALLGVTRTGLLYKMKRLGISRALIAASEPESVEIGGLEAGQPAPLRHSPNSSTTA